MYVCRKMNNSQARTGHQRVMGGRGTDDDDTHERHTDTNKLTRHTASWLPHTLSSRTHNSRPRIPPVVSPSQVAEGTNRGTTKNPAFGGTPSSGPPRRQLPTDRPPMLWLVRDPPPPALTTVPHHPPVSVHSATHSPAHPARAQSAAACWKRSGGPWARLVAPRPSAVCDEGAGISRTQERWATHEHR